MFQAGSKQASGREKRSRFRTGRNHQSGVTPRAATALLGVAPLLLLAGCGNQYRPVVAAINPVGPAIQPTKYAFAVSNPNGTNTSGTTPALVTVVDFSGDSILATPSILTNPAVGPNTFAVTAAGTEGFVVNNSDNLSDITLAQPTTLISSQIIETVLPSGATQTVVPPSMTPVPPATMNAVEPSITPLMIGNQSERLFITEPGRRSIAVTSVGPPALINEITLPSGVTPTYVVGLPVSFTAGPVRTYVLSSTGTSSTGYAQALEGATLSLGGQIKVGNNPTYGLMSPDGRRAFILNTGSGTVNVFNVVNNALDTASPVIPAPTTSNPNPILGLKPVWADIASRTNLLVVLNQGDGVNPGSLSIISVPLCSATAQPGNTTCDANNPVDATGFGTVVATVPVGVNPTMVSILQDVGKAYVCNQGAAGQEGSISVVDLTKNTVTATIPAISAATATQTESSSPTMVYGHPNTIAAMTGDPTGKVYVTSSDNRFMTVIQTDSDTVDTHINLQGLGVRVLASAQ